MLAKTQQFFLVLAIFLSGAWLLLPQPASAQACALCADGSTPRVDFACQREKIFNPETVCDVCLCGNSSISESYDFNFFGITFRLDSDKAIGQLLYLGFSGFLGVIAFATVGYGIWGIVKRSRSETDDDIAAAQKIVTNAVIGFVIIVVSLVIAQVVAAFLGLGSITELTTLPDIIAE